MSTPSGGASGLSQCACTNISLMQLFHELKQQFPGVPDHVVSNTIATHCHDKSACQTRLQKEVKASVTHAFLASSLTGQRKDKERNAEFLVKCPNQVTDKISPPIEAIAALVIDEQNKGSCVIADHAKDALVQLPNNTESNLLICKDILRSTGKTDIHAESFESTSSSSNDDSDEETQQVNNKTFKVLKSNKISCHLNEKLSLESNSKLTNVCDDTDANQNEKPKRPCTLEIKKEEPPYFDCRLEKEKTGVRVTSAESQKQTEEKTVNTDRGGNWDSPGFNVSVNLNCRMDLTPSYGHNPALESWLDEGAKPRGYASVNLTVCTPTSSVTSPAGEMGEPRAFEGRVTVTVNPTISRVAPPPPTLRRAPPPPVCVPPTNENTDLLEMPASGMTQIELLRFRQRTRLTRMKQAVAAERARLAAAAREAALLSAPLPPPRAARRLRSTVSALRQSCQRLAAALDQQPSSAQVQAQTYTAPNAHETEGDFYSNIYTGQRPRQPQPPSPMEQRADLDAADDCPPWLCDYCTFRNHGLLNKCEECGMPRILVGTKADRSMSQSLDSGVGTLTLSDIRLARPNCAMLEAGPNSAC